MQRFRCPVCSAEVFSADVTCLTCTTELVLDLARREMVAVTDGWSPCANRATIACNWSAVDGGLCRSCRMTTVVPPAGNDDACTGWADAERAKRRLVLQLVDLGLVDPVGGRGPGPDPVFEMRWSADGSVTIGHADGVITLDVGEADDVRRERLRQRLSEPYRTVLGHLRHEIGHFFWPRCAQLPNGLERLRSAFGDEGEDYAGAVDAHYGEGPGAAWQDDFISEYATMHPWEDWAESFAHYLHQRDVLDTATGFGLVVERPTLDGDSVRMAAPGGAHVHFEELETQWRSLTVAVNALNRSVEQPDLYPFAPSAAVVDKVRVVHDLLAELAS